MWTTVKQLWNDEAGFILSAELVLITTILTLGMIVGLSSVSAAINQEMGDVSMAFSMVNQGYRYSEMRGSDWSDRWNHNGGQLDVACHSGSMAKD